MPDSDQHPKQRALRLIAERGWSSLAAVARLVQARERDDQVAALRALHDELAAADHVDGSEGRDGRVFEFYDCGLMAIVEELERS